ncbi:hypothetical protein EMIT0P228_90133 [Pseudomonas brassicacearum]|nr:hypothetical protein GCM10020185_18620 [Pseudomonas brassicacearum subsp. brassicacearum]
MPASYADRSSRSAWECRQGRSAFRFWKVTQSVTGCMPTQSVGTIGYNIRHPRKLNHRYREQARSHRGFEVE